MDYAPIADLRPDLFRLESKWVKAIVMVKWPYSSLKHELAVILAEPELRLRAKNEPV
ncbi:hypothetical protein Alg130_11261 [Pyrenophora tritici-repentis]|nr:hypothetical protein Alg130_11261 [Pyrenophora tritici-repentis]